jgi:hypothetical protein
MENLNPEYGNQDGNQDENLYDDQDGNQEELIDFEEVSPS